MYITCIYTSVFHEKEQRKDRILASLQAKGSS